MKKIFIFIHIFILTACTHSSGWNNQSDVDVPGPFSVLVGFYRGPLNHLSAVRHGSCPMHPSCSEYARQAIEKHGEILGWIMTCDRLMRCGRDETHISPKIRINGQLKYADSLEQNELEKYQE